MSMTRWFAALALALPLLSACGSGGESAAQPTAAPTTGDSATGSGTATTGSGGDVDRSKLSKELRLFNWSEYLSPDVKSDFEQEYGVTIIEDLYDSNEVMLPKVRSGNSGYDIVVPSDYAVQSMVADGLLEPLDKSLLTNIGNLDPNFAGLYYDPENTYSLPYFWGVAGIAYSKTAFPTAPDSWGVLLDPANAEKISGQFTMLDDSRETPGAALFYQGQSVNTTDEAALAKAQELLIAQKPFVSAYDSANVNLKLATGEITIGHAWSGIAATAILGIDDKPGNPDIAFVVPKEGSTISMDNLAILKESQNKYTAHVFLNYLMRPEVAAKNASYVLYQTPVKGAQELLDPEVRDVLNAIRPDDATLKRLQWIERTTETDTLYSNLWTQVLGQ